MFREVKYVLNFGERSSKSLFKPGPILLGTMLVCPTAWWGPHVSVQPQLENQFILITPAAGIQFSWLESQGNCLVSSNLQIMIEVQPWNAGIAAALTVNKTSLLPSIVPITWHACKPFVIAGKRWEIFISPWWFDLLLLLISAIVVIAAQRDNVECDIEMLPSSFRGSSGDAAAGDKAWWFSLHSGTRLWSH